MLKHTKKMTRSVQVNLVNSSLQVSPPFLFPISIGRKLLASSNTELNDVKTFSQLTHLLRKVGGFS